MRKSLQSALRQAQDDSKIAQDYGLKGYHESLSAQNNEIKLQY